MKGQKQKTQGPTGLISAVVFEADLLLEGVNEDTGPMVTLPFKGRQGQRVLYTCSGMGAANAARAATMLIERESPGLVVSFGIGGAYPGSGLNKGDVALAEKEIYADTGVALPGGIKGVDVRIEAVDAYGDAPKAFGNFRFEMYKFVPNSLDPKGKRLATWEESVLEPKANDKTWGPLVILEKIGAGAFGDVYRAREPRLDRQVALKFFRPHHLSLSQLTSDVIEEGST